MRAFEQTDIRVTINVVQGAGSSNLERPRSIDMALAGLKLPLSLLWSLFTTVYWLAFGLIVGLMWALLARRS
jgi:hypothetical protein